jgi:hypothetical protein
LGLTTHQKYKIVTKIHKKPWTWSDSLKELHNLYSSPNITRMIKSRRMRWAGHVARMWKTRNAYRILVGRPEGKRPLGRPNIGGWTILKWILER